MISEAEFRTLMERSVKAGTAVLSVYLSFDLFKRDPLVREFEAELKSMLHQKKLKLSSEERRELARDAAPVVKFVSDYKPKAPGLVVFSDASENFFFARPLRILVEDRLEWQALPYLLPLLEAFDEYERYGVILADKGRARLFTVFLGEIEEEKDAIASNDVSRFKSTPKDHLRSVNQLERTEKLHVLWHLKHVIRMMEKMADRRVFHRLILGGPTEAVHELEKLLPAAFKSRVAGRLSLPFWSDTQKVLKGVLELEEKIERENEAKLVDQLLTQTHKHKGGVLGVQETMVALKKNQILKVVYAAGFTRNGSRCTGCGASFDTKRQMCRGCSLISVPSGELMESLARSVIQKNGKIEQVRGEAAEHLEKEGGIGAFLKGPVSRRRKQMVLRG